jgi:peptidoglycan hydrolase-like protein with peptidoglycan-binding domain
VFLGACSAAVVLGASGLAAAAFIKSPAEVAASTQPPSPAVLSIPVVREELRASVTFRGTVEVTGEQTATPGSETGAARLVVTSVNARVGEMVGAGQVLLSVSGRPLYVLPGAFPAYRDMEPGDQGPDIAELQAALQELGYSTSPDPDGYFGRGTDRAVRDFYAAIGYPVPTVAAAADGQAPPAGSRGLNDSEPMVPMAEVMFVPILPARLIALSGGVGSQVIAPLVTVMTGSLTIAGQLETGQGALVRIGMRVSISDSLTRFQTTGRVRAVGVITQTASGVPVIPVTIAPARMPLSEVGADVTISEVTASTPGPVLVVPEGAIITDAAGQTFVQVRGPGQRIRKIAVTAGVSSDGLVAVSAAGGGLTIGDQVVVGS